MINGDNGPKTVRLAQKNKNVASCDTEGVGTCQERNLGMTSARDAPRLNKYAPRRGGIGRVIELNQGQRGCGVGNGAHRGERTPTRRARHRNVVGRPGNRASARPKSHNVSRSQNNIHTSVKLGELNIRK